MMGIPAPIDRHKLEPVLAPFGRSFTLPAEAYVSEEVFEWERKAFFEDSWICLGRAADLCDGPNSACEITAGRESLVLTRGATGDLSLLFNVCRHRGHELLVRGERRDSKVLQCPYHSWVYSLDGSLRGAPHFSETEGFDKAVYPLISARMAEWHGWLFANISDDAPELPEHIGNLDPVVQRYRPGELVVGARHDYEVAANWKIVTENYHECYHCPTIHPELCRVSPPDSGFNLNPDGAWVGGTMDLGHGMDTMSLDGRSLTGPFEWLDDTDRRQVFYFGLFPNLLLSLHPDYLMTHRFEPLAPARTRIECCWLWHRETVARPDFDPGYAVEFWDITNRQDWAACEGVQRGAASRGFRQGPLSPSEDAVYHFLTLIASSYLAGEVGRPAAIEGALGAG
jgi:glycine betaine catabolism A